MNEFTLHLKYEEKKPELEETAQNINKNLVERVERSLREILEESGVDNYTLKKGILSLSPDLKFPDEELMDLFFGWDIFSKTEAEKQYEANKEEFDEKIDQQVEEAGRVFPSGFTSEYVLDHLEKLEGYGVALVGSPLYDKGKKYWKLAVADRENVGTVISRKYLKGNIKSRLRFDAFRGIEGIGK